MIATGALLFGAEAVKCYNSPFFRIKVLLLGVAGLNALLFHKTVFQTVDKWDQDASTPFRAKVAGASSLLIWIGVVAMGRALAYA